MHELLELYLEVDTLLLAECIVYFRKKFFHQLHLDCCNNYLGLSHVSLDAALLNSGAELQLCTDPDMLLLIEKVSESAALRAPSGI